MKSSNYITILGWMRTELDLKGNQLILYAMIYGFSQDEGSKFMGSLTYIQRALGVSRQTAVNLLNGLEEKGLITKEVNRKGNLYSASKKSRLVQKVESGSKKTRPQVVQKVDRASPKTRPNIYKNNNTKDTNKDSEFAAFWNENCKLAKVTKMTPCRRKHLRSRINEHGKDSYYEVIKKINDSSFLQGDNNRKWKATFDWVINENNYIKVLEGNYGGKKVSKANDGVLKHKHEDGYYDRILSRYDEL